MPTIQGPQFKGERELKKYNELKAKYPSWPDVKVRRIVSGLSNTNTRRK